MASSLGAASPSAIDLGMEHGRSPTKSRTTSSSRSSSMGRRSISIADCVSRHASAASKKNWEAEDTASNNGSQSSPRSSIKSPLRKTISTPSLYTDDEYLNGDGKQTEKYRSHPQLSVTRRKNLPISAKNKLPAIHDISATEGEVPAGSQTSSSNEALKLPSIRPRYATVTTSETTSPSDEQLAGRRHSRPSLYEKYGEVAAIAEEELKHNWILAEEELQRRKLSQLREARVLMSLAKEDPLDDIEQRMEELSLMAKPRRDERPVLDRVSEKQKQLILVG